MVCFKNKGKKPKTPSSFSFHVCPSQQGSCPFLGQLLVSSRGLQRRGRGPQAQGEEPHLLFLSYTQSRMTHAYRRRRPLPSRPEPRGHLVASCSLWTLWACCYLFNSCKLNCLQCFKTYFLFLRLKCPGNRMCFFPLVTIKIR